jgi:hypothetical protein
MHLENSSLNNGAKTFIHQPSVRRKYDLQLCLHGIKSHVKRILKAEQILLPNRTIGIKFQLSAHVQLKKYEQQQDDENPKIRYLDPFFTSTVHVYYRSSFDDDDIEQVFQEIKNSFEAFIQQGSGWILDYIKLLRLKTFQYKILSGGGGNTNKNGLCKELINKRACLNIPCSDEKCFLFSCLAHLHKIKRNPCRLKQYLKYENELNTQNIHFPMSIDQVKIFEIDNPMLSINVLAYDENKVIPIYVTKNRTNDNSKVKINLLLYKKHYYLIRSMSRLLNDQSPHTNHRWHFCHWCLCRFKAGADLKLHSNLCRQKLQRQSVPPPQKIQFKNYKHMFKAKFVIYYDIEAILQKCKKTNKTLHKAISVCVYRKCINNKYSKPPVIFTGLDCIDKFLDHLQEEALSITKILDNVNEPLKWNEKDRERFRSTKKCEVCNSIFHSVHNVKYRDHEHLGSNSSSNIRFILCNKCNLTYGATNYRIPVIAHNGTSYDHHYIITHLNESMKISIIAKNTEKFISLKLGKHLVFIDSLNFLSGSLNVLAKDLCAKDDNNLYFFLNYITKNPEKQKLLHQKGSFPYDWLDSVECLEVDALPSRAAFFDSLSNQEISEESYERAQKIWHRFHCKTMQDYLELYLKLDVMLLAGIMESYRNSTYEHFKLDPLNYLTGPSLCFDAMLKITEIKLDTIPSLDMYLWFHKSIRGGYSGSSLRYVKANNDLCDKFNPNGEISHIIALDANQLYGHSMSQHLPVGNFRWLSNKDIETFDIHSIALDETVGYFLEVDLIYPKELHDLHNDYPLAPAKTAIDPVDWSEYMHEVVNSLNMKTKSGGVKLMATLHNKTNYIVHFKNLKLYLKLGLQLSKIHRILAFDQKPFMKKYIDLNIRKRKAATSSFEIALYKGYNNHVFGMTMYNVFNQSNYTIVHRLKHFQRLAGKPTFHSCQIINTHLIGVQMKPNNILCNKPIYIGASVLDLAKQHMYAFYYEYLVPMYAGTGLRMIYTDTDSFYLHIKNQSNLYLDFLHNERFFDRSNYPPKHFLHSNKRKRKLGLMKNEHTEGQITEMCALRAKMYAVRICNEKDDLKAKGLKRSIISELSMENYLSCLRNISTTHHNYKQIRSFRHQIVTQKQQKIGLSPFDDKRYILDCGIHTLGHGHYKTKSSPQFNHCNECFKNQ